MDEIQQYGQNILESEAYKACGRVKHHMKTTAAAHEMEVAKLSVKIAHVIAKIGVKTDIQTIVEIALCHDLGMACRHEFFPYTTAWRHPVESVHIAEKIIPLSWKVRNGILFHMWPLCIIPPLSLEGNIVMWADKTVAIIDCFSGYLRADRTKRTLANSD